MSRSFPRFRRICALVLASMQLGVIAAALTERSERSPVAHVEPEGTSVHAVHDETFCPACQASLAVGRVVEALNGAPVQPDGAPLPVVARTIHRADHLSSLHGSRAPPSV